ncbi:S9 family peptidase [Colwellia sp. 4_MG-2023]|uniref:S9 family peptidase n=1 Tax=unclassified Colwellia TaxID=196834 RepID=UPI002090E53B|nr:MULTISPECIES: S9 family peptidase [unclassified Colwellia]MDO6486126.1 S9 family peptidase [Colwellia sp. 6_MG-2023]MDO6505914.1 S9 family peptidase [Colwellia sp. 5_MG-2023]MDO6554595.1 S9 family peptidase [Colwellia sp. 4_MG-2023]MDO6653267.1 S9 family peptidase [Colwellia sp. 3_MG-2023]MDO6664488.1 S9 family peptidase [Colwellia sp. 2_MG-2023]
MVSFSGFASQPESTLQLENVFDLEYANQLEMTNNGKTVYFVRNRMDIKSDRKVSNIWSVDSDSTLLQPLTSGVHMDYSPVLSPDESRLAFISTRDGSSQIYIKWLKTGAVAKISNLTQSPSNLHWSPNGKQLIFSQFVPAKAATPVNLPGKPEGADWADPAKYIDEVYYRADGGGYTKAGFSHLFSIDANGGNARQLTSGNFNHGGAISFAEDGNSLYFSANRHDEYKLKPTNSEIYTLDLTSLTITAVTDRVGPDSQPRVSPNGRYLAYTGYDDKRTNYENTQLYIRDLKSGKTTSLTTDFDRSVGQIKWADDSKGVYFSYASEGQTVLAYQPRNGKRKVLTERIGSVSFGRPYSGGDFDVSEDGDVAITFADTQRPADVALVKRGKTQRLTHLNEDALGNKQLAKVEEIWLKSSHDSLPIQGWVAYPPGFDSKKKYPLILEIHGGPVANYGPHFSAEVQLFAAKGNVVLYMNPRGSDSYGKEFAQTIHHNYPSNDFDDLMTGVDALIAKGFIDESNLFVTGGSGGGVLTAWIVGHTDRFAAAVVAKPVINWISFVLTADFYPFFADYWFPGKPWDHIEHYMKRSPISYVGNVKTPTMLLTGEADYRTPISETEQFYQALKLQDVDTAMVRIPDASHGITKRPSNLMSKVAYIQWWFDKHSNK